MHESRLKIVHPNVNITNKLKKTISFCVIFTNKLIILKSEKKIVLSITQVNLIDEFRISISLFENIISFLKEVEYHFHLSHMIIGLIVTSFLWMLIIGL